MPLECLAVTCDPSLMNRIRSGTGDQVAFQICKDAASAVDVAARRHLDGFVIDCDDVAGGAEALTRVRSSRSNRQTPIIAVVNGKTSVPRALELGANFALSKPIEESRLRSVLDLTLPKMEREHRRYFRYEVALPVRLLNHAGHSFITKMRNVSEDGLATRLIDPTSLDGIVVVEFEIPEKPQPTFRAKAEIAWTDSSAMGVRFLHVDQESCGALRTWLDSLAGEAEISG